MRCWRGYYVLEALLCPTKVSAMLRRSLLLCPPSLENLKVVHRLITGREYSSWPYRTGEYWQTIQLVRSCGFRASHSESGAREGAAMEASVAVIGAGGLEFLISLMNPLLTNSAQDADC